MKNYNQSPLPFQGQKRKFVRAFKEELVKSYSEEFVYVDLFGGSGLLAHTVKSIYPNAQVIFNDYDDFKKRLNSIKSTNKILDQIRPILSGYPRGKAIVGEYRERVLNVLREADKSGYVDYITLSSNLMFSMNYATNLKGIINDTLYNNVRKSNYDTANGYLEDVIIVRSDYKPIFEYYKDKEVVFLVDPPYLSTDCSTYLSEGYWQLKDYLDVLQVLTNQNYFYFTSNKSQIVELCEWISSVSATANPFENAHVTALSTTLNHTSRYTDIMYHYKKTDYE